MGFEVILRGAALERSLQPPTEPANTVVSLSCTDGMSSCIKASTEPALPHMMSLSEGSDKDEPLCTFASGASCASSAALFVGGAAAAGNAVVVFAVSACVAAPAFARQAGAALAAPSSFFAALPAGGLPRRAGAAAAAIPADEDTARGKRKAALQSRRS